MIYIIRLTLYASGEQSSRGLQISPVAVAPPLPRPPEPPRRPVAVTTQQGADGGAAAAAAAGKASFSSLLLCPVMDVGASI